MSTKPQDKVKRKGCAKPVDYRHDETITVDDVAELAVAGNLRYRAFGESGIFGDTLPYNGDYERAARDVSVMLSLGYLTAYIDEHGIFIGPNAIGLVERDPFVDGGALQ
jgi:hypothetical protein